jgi:hypothetical protein
MTIPPDNVAAGQAGHLSAHDNIADVLTAHGAQLAGIPAIRYGTATLASGTVTVSDSAITSSSVVHISRLSPSGTLGNLSVSAVNPGSGFTITSSSGSENSSVAYLVLG